MRFVLAFVGAALAALCVVPAGAQLEVFSGKPLMIIDNLGYTMSEQDAMERITFRPFVPTTNYLEVALLPAFHGDDKDHPENRGIGYEYTMSQHTFVLREWPQAGGGLDKYPPAPAVGKCTDLHVILGTASKPHGYAWTTGALVFAVQPDPPTDTKPLKAELSRLVQHGACR
jgi:hypothetical protein